ncbi:MAG: MBL fold metallo-hydrolase [Firmicutes bacterium]|nr:MBL fold metallo-hydrolase [Bacillota bacterium]
MEIKRYVLGNLGANCYLLVSRKGDEALVIDPGGDPAPVLQDIKEQGLNLLYIINTHGHGDHIGGNGALQKATGAEILIHRGDAHMLASAIKNLSIFTGDRCTSPAADRLLEDGDIISWGQESHRVLHTPGHTPGSICLLGEGHVFSGDTLFAGSVGRTDFPGSSPEDILTSIKGKLLTLPPETRVLPGHGPETDIGTEKRSNPFLRS